MALGYDAYFGPRFAPYLGAAIGALLARQEQLPSGALLVPCVGPGRELCPLAHAFVGRKIAASDLSTTMVGRARERLLDLRMEHGPLGRERAIQELRAWAADEGLDVPGLPPAEG